MSIFLIFDCNYYFHGNTVRGLYTDIIDLKNNIVLNLIDEELMDSIEVAEYLPNTKLPKKTYIYLKVFVRNDIQIDHTDEFYDHNINYETGNYYFISRELITEIEKKWPEKNDYRNVIDFFIKDNQIAVVPTWIKSKQDEFIVKLTIDPDNCKFLINDLDKNGL